MTKNVIPPDKPAVAQFYNRLAPLYAWLRDFGHYKDVDHKEHLIAHLKPFESDIVLDVGTGPGIYAIDIAQRSPECRVVGIDISQAFIDIANRKAKAAGVDNVQFSLGNIENLDFDDEAFNKIICAGVISVIKNRTQAAKELARILRPGGRLAVREPLRSDGRLGVFAAGRPETSILSKFFRRSGLMFGHFSPDFMTAPELEKIFADVGFSRFESERCGQDIIVTAVK